VSGVGVGFELVGERWEEAEHEVCGGGSGDVGLFGCPLVGAEVVEERLSRMCCMRMRERDSRRVR
jgi:hypothetical protein